MSAAKFEDALHYLKIINEIQHDSKDQFLAYFKTCDHDTIEGLVNAMKRSGDESSRILISRFFGHWDDTHRQEPCLLGKQIIVQILDWFQNGVPAVRNDGGGRNSYTLSSMQYRI